MTNNVKDGSPVGHPEAPRFRGWRAGVESWFRMSPMVEVAPRSVDAIDWHAWRPRDTATLLFVVRSERVLLIRKKRGLGAGKINGPGGRLLPGETPEVAAIREVEEELRVVPTSAQPRGELSFQFVGGYSIHVHVFTSTGCVGHPTETDEARPLWTPVDRIPYDEMWEDDRLWLPWMLEGRRFLGRFIFDGDEMVDHRLEPTRS